MDISAVVVEALHECRPRQGGVGRRVGGEGVGGVRGYEGRGERVRELS